MSTFTHTVIMQDGQEFGMTFAGTPAVLAYGRSHKNVQSIMTDRGTVEYEAGLFPHLSTPRFKPGDKVTYFSTVTRLTMHNATIIDRGMLTRDEADDPDELIYRIYLVKAAGAPEMPVGAGVGSRWSENSILHGWLQITDPLNADQELLRQSLISTATT